jgi:hypothetical protein
MPQPMKQHSNADDEIIKVNPSHLRKYIVEYSILALASCVVFLFLAVVDLNNFIRTNLIEQRIEVTKVVEHNSAVIEDWNREREKEKEKK